MPLSPAHSGKQCQGYHWHASLRNLQAYTELSQPANKRIIEHSLEFHLKTPEHILGLGCTTTSGNACAFQVKSQWALNQRWFLTKVRGETWALQLAAPFQWLKSRRIATNDKPPGKPARFSLTSNAERCRRCGQTFPFFPKPCK